jgi:uncharacterized protein YceK
MKDKMNLVAIISLIIMIIIFILMTGCSTKTIIKKEIVEKKIYIKSPCPKLKVFEYNKSIVLDAYLKNDKICVIQWDACLPKEKMFELMKHIKMLKEVNKKYREEITKYNKFIREQNRSK